MGVVPSIIAVGVLTRLSWALGERFQMYLCADGA
jgi:hypothetical protein